VLLLAAGALSAVASFLPLYSREYGGEEEFAVGAWNTDPDLFAETPTRWGIPMLMAAAALVVGAVLVLVSRWARRIRPAGAAVGALGVGGVLAVGWLLGGFAGYYVDFFNDESLVGPDYAADTRLGTVLVVVAMWVGLAALVPLVLAPVLDAVRARATAGGAR
jgi:hypothetical protein